MGATKPTSMLMVQKYVLKMQVYEHISVRYMVTTKRIKTSHVANRGGLVEAQDNQTKVMQESEEFPPLLLQNLTNATLE